MEKYVLCLDPKCYETQIFKESSIQFHRDHYILRLPQVQKTCAQNIYLFESAFQAQQRVYSQYSQTLKRIEKDMQAQINIIKSVVKVTKNRIKSMFAFKTSLMNFDIVGIQQNSDIAPMLLDPVLLEKFNQKCMENQGKMDSFLRRDLMVIFAQASETISKFINESNLHSKDSQLKIHGGNFYECNSSAENPMQQNQSSQRGQNFEPLGTVYSQRTATQEYTQGYAQPINETRNLLEQISPNNQFINGDKVEESGNAHKMRQYAKKRLQNSQPSEASNNDHQSQNHQTRNHDVNSQNAQTNYPQKLKNYKHERPTERLVFINTTKDFKDVSEQLEKANSFQDIQLNFEGSKIEDFDLFTNNLMWQKNLSVLQLNFSGSDFFELGKLGEALSSIPQLTQLKLDLTETGVSITTSFSNSLSSLKHLTQLEINLSHTYITQVDDLAKGIRYLPLAQLNLDFSRNNIQQIQVFAQVIGQLRSLNQLMLNFFDTDINDISYFSSLQNLRLRKFKLDVSQTKLPANLRRVYHDQDALEIALGT